MKRQTFKECIEKEQLIETGDKDLALAKELLNLAKHREQFWQIVKHHAKTYPSLFLEGYYEILKELTTAIIAIDGWKALNHECLFTYLKEKKQELEIDFTYLAELKDLRNSKIKRIS